VPQRKNDPEPEIGSKKLFRKKGLQSNKLIPSYPDCIGNWDTFSINITGYKYSDQLFQ